MTYILRRATGNTINLTVSDMSLKTYSSVPVGHTEHKSTLYLRDG